MFAYALARFAEPASGETTTRFFINNAEVPRIFAEQCTCKKGSTGFEKETLNPEPHEGPFNDPVGTAHLDAVRTDPCADGNMGFILLSAFA